MSMSYQTPCLEGLEPRLLLTTLVGGDVFEYMDEDGQWYRVALEGDLIVELIGDRVTDQNTVMLGHLSGAVVSSETGGTRDYEQAVQIIGSISTFGNEADDFAVNAIASADEYGNGDTYGFSVTTENDVLTVRLMQLTPSATLDSLTTTMTAFLQNATLRDDSRISDDTITLTGDPVAAAPNDFAVDPTDGLAYFVAAGELYSADRDSGEVTDIGALGGVTNVQAMGFTTAGVLYVIGDSGGAPAIQQIDKTTGGAVGGAAAISGLTAGNTYLFTGMAYNGTDFYASALVTPATGDPFYQLWTVTTGGAASGAQSLGEAKIRALTYATLTSGGTPALVGIDTSQSAGARLAMIDTTNGTVSALGVAGSVQAGMEGLGSYAPLADGVDVLYGANTATLFRGSAATLEVDGDGKSTVKAIHAADFRPTTGSTEDGLLFFVVRWGDSETDTLYSIDVNRATTAEIQSSLRSWGQVQTSSDQTVVSIAWDLTDNGADARLLALRNNADTASILELDPTNPQAPLANLSSSTVVSSVTSRGEAVMDITAIELVNDDPTSAESSLVAVRSAGRDSTLVQVDLDDGTCLVLRHLPLPEDPNGNPVAGEDIQALAWNPLLVSPFTGEYGVLLGVDVGTDQLVMIDSEFRGENLFAIYISQCSSDSSLSIAAVPDIDQDDRPMLPFEGSAGQLRVTNAQDGSLILISAPGNTGAFYLGDRTVDINPDVDEEDLIPILRGDLDGELGIRAAGVDDWPTDGDSNVSAGLVLDESLLAYVSADPTLLNRLLGNGFNWVQELAVDRQERIAVIDSDGETDQLGFADPVTGQITGTVYDVTDTTTGETLRGVLALAYGDHDPTAGMGTGWLTGLQQLFAVYDITDPIPAASIGGDLGGDFTLAGLTVTRGGVMYAVVDNAGTLELYRINRDVLTGAVTSFTSLGAIRERTSGTAVEDITALEADPVTGALYVTGTIGGAGNTRLFSVSPFDARATELYDLGAVYTVKAMACSFDGTDRVLYGVVDVGGVDTLASIDLGTGAVSAIGAVEAPNGSPTDIRAMDFKWDNGRCESLYAIDANSGGQVIAIDLASPDQSLVIGAFDPTDFSGYTCDRNGIFYSVNSMGAGSNDEVWASPGKVSVLGTLDETTGDFTRIGVLRSADGSVTLDGVETMAFRHGPSNLQPLRDALYVVDGDGVLYEINPATGAIVSKGYNLLSGGNPVEIEAMDFDAEKNLLAYDRPNGRLVDIALVALQPFVAGAPNGSLTVGGVVATSVGSLRPTIGGLAYDATNDRFLTVDNATGNIVRGGTGTTSSSVLMELKGTTSDSAAAQNVNSILIGGTVTGKVDISGNVDDTFYAGWLITGDTTGQPEGSPQVPENFLVGGDIYNLVVSAAIGTLDGSGLDAPTYVTGFDMQVTGKVGQVWTLDSLVGSVHAENRASYLIPHDAANTYQQEIEYLTEEEHPEGYLFQTFELYRADSAFLNDTFATAQYLGTMGLSSGQDEGVIEVRGTLQDGGSLEDHVDYYGLALLAGQTITVQLTGGAWVGVFDPDGRLIVTDYSDVDPDSTFNEEFRFTADRPGVYRFAIGGAPFDGSETFSSDVPYVLTIADVGDLAIGAVKVGQDFFNNTSSPSVYAQHGDIGGIYTGNTLFFEGVLPDVQADAGSLRSIDAARVGLGINTDEFGVNITVQHHIGLLRSRSLQLNIESAYIGGNLQLADAMTDFYIYLEAGGGVGVIRAGTMATETPSVLNLNVDGVGDDGIIDLIDVTGDFGTLEAGGPQITTGPNGDVRYMRVGGAIFQDFFFGSGTYTGVTLAPGQSASIRDDSGGYIHIAPQAVATHIPTGLPADPVTGVLLKPEQLPYLTYRAYGIRGSGGSVLVDVTSTGGFVASANSNRVGAPVQIGKITVQGPGRAVVQRADGKGVELTPQTNYLYNRDLNVILRGSTANPIDVFEIVGGNFSTISNETGGEIVNVVATSIGTLYAYGSIGLPKNHTGAAVNPRQDLVAANSFVPAGYPFLQQHVGVVVSGHVVKIESCDSIGNVMVNGSIQKIVANSGRNVNRTDGVFRGLAAPVFATGDIYNVYIGEGIAPSGSGSFAHAGVFAQGKIWEVTTNNSSGGDVRGAIVGERGVGRVALANGSIINADIIAGTLVSAREYGDKALSRNVESISLSGIGGIIGACIAGFNIGNITVSGGFGMFNSVVDTVNGNARIGDTTVDGFGIRMVDFETGGDQGNITATGRGALASALNYSPAVRYSETETYLPGTDQPLSRLNDIHLFLGTTIASPLDRQGLLEDVWADGNGNLGVVSGYRITSRERTSQFCFANSIRGFQTYPIHASDTATNSIDGLTITTGSLGFFNPAQDVNNLDMTIAGHIQSMLIRGSLLGSSSITTAGPNGYIQNLTIQGDMEGSVRSNGIIGTMTILGDMTGDLIVAPMLPVRTALQTLTIYGNYNGTFDVNGNVGTIDVGGDLGVTGDTLQINGNLSTLTVGRRLAGSDMAIDCNVLGNVGSMNIYGGMSGDAWVSGNLTRLNVVNPGTAITGDLTVMGTLSSATITGGDWNSAMTAGNAVGTVTIVGADLAAGGSITCLLGDINMVWIRGGDLFGTVSAPNGTIRTIRITGSNLGAASLIEAGQITLLQIDGSVLAGARVVVDNELTTLRIGGNVQAGSSVTAGSIGTLTVGGSLLGNFAIGYGSRGATIRVSGNLGSNGSVFSCASDLRLYVSNIAAGATVYVSRDLALLQATGTIFGDVIVDGSITTLQAAALTGATILSGMDMTTVRITGAVATTLLQAGINRGNDGDFSTVDSDGSQISRMGRIGTLRIGGSVANSILNAGGHLATATVTGNLTNTSISSGLVLSGAAIAAILADATPLATVAEQNTARAGATLLWGNFTTATVSGTMVNSDLTAGVSPGADGQFGTADDTVSTSLTGGNSAFGTVTTAGSNAASNVLSDAGIGRNRIVGAANTDFAVTYNVTDADLTGGVALETLRGTAQAGAPVTWGGITVTVIGTGFVDVRHDAGGAIAGSIDTLVLRGTNARTQVNVTGGGTIGRILTEDDAVVGTFTYNGTLAGAADPVANPNVKALWLDAGPITTFTLGTLHANVRGGRIGGDVTSLTLGTQNAGELRVGGSVNTLRISAGTDPLLTALGAVGANTDIGAMAVDGGPATVWVFNTATNQFEQRNLNTGAVTGGSAVSVYSYLNAAPGDTSAPLVVAAMDMDFAGSDLFAVAELWSLSPTRTVGAMGNRELSLNALAVLQNGNLYAIENSNMLAMEGELPQTGGYAALAYNADDGLFYTVYNNAGTYELHTVDIAAGRVTGTTLIGAIQFGGTDVTDIYDMDFNADGDLYLIGRLGGAGNQRLFTVNLFTGAANDVGEIDLATTDNFVGLAFGSDGETLYAVRDEGAGQDRLYAVDTAAAATTEMGGAGNGVIQIGGVGADIVGMDVDAQGHILALDASGGAGSYRPITVNLSTPSSSWELDDAGSIGDLTKFTSDDDGVFYSISQPGVGNARIFSTPARDRLVQIDPTTGVRTPVGYLRDIYGNYYYNDVYALAGNGSNVLYAILKDADGKGGSREAADGAALARIATTATGGNVRVSSPTLTTSPAVLLDGGGVAGPFPALAVNAGGTIYAIRRTGGVMDVLYRVATSGVLTAISPVSVSGAHTQIVGMGFDNKANLVAYDLSGGAGLINLSDPVTHTLNAASVADAQRVTTADALNPNIDAYAIGRSGADGYTAYAFDTDNVVGGLFYQSPGQVATLGTIETNLLASDYGYFRQLTPLEAAIDGTGLTSAVRDMSFVSDSEVYVITADGVLYRYDRNGDLQAVLGTVRDAATGEALSLTDFDFDTNEGAMIAIDGRYNRLVTLNTDPADFLSRGGLGSNQIIDVSVDDDGQMYALRNLGSVYRIYRVDRDAAGGVLGVTNQVGTGNLLDPGLGTPAIRDIRALDVHSSGVIYFIGRPGGAGTTQALYTLTTAGTVEKIADLTLGGEDVTDSAVALGFSDQTLYAVLDVGGVHTLYRVNTSDGTLTEMLDPTLTSGAIEVGGAAMTILGMDAGPDGVLLATATTGAGQARCIRIDVTDPGASVNLTAAGSIPDEYIGFAVDADSRAFVIDSSAATYLLRQSQAATAEARLEAGSVNAGDLTVLSYDDTAADGTFYTFSDSLGANGQFACLNGTQQENLHGLTINSANNLILGDGYAGRIVATGNTFQNVTVSGGFEGTLYTAGAIVKYTQTGGDFSGSLYAGKSLGTITLGGNLLDGGLLHTPGVLGTLRITGTMSGDLSAGTGTRLTFGSLGAMADVRVSTAVGTFQVSGNLTGLVDLGSVTTFTSGNLNTSGSDSANVQIHGRAGTVRLTGGTDAGSLLQVDGSVGTLNVQGTHAGTIAVDVGVRTAQFVTLANAFVVIGQNVTTLTVSGNVTSSVLSIGTTLGADGLYNTSDDRITGGTLQTGTIRGNFLNSALVAGVLPNLDYGPGLPAAMWYYTGDTSASLNEIDSAEVGGVLPSAINRLTFYGRTGTIAGGNASAVAAETLGTIVQRDPWSDLYTRDYNDPILPPSLEWSYIQKVSDSQVKIFFTEEINTASLILSIDTDNDGSVTGLTDVQGTITVYDYSSGAVYDGVTLSYTKETDDQGRVHGVLVLTQSNLFNDSATVAVEFSGSLTTPTPPAILGLSGLRSARRDLVDAAAPMGTIFDGDGNGVEGGDTTVYFGEYDIGAVVPEYEWWYGCAPTAAGMIMGYYDANGFGNLIVGDAFDPGNLANVHEAIASSGDGVYNSGYGPDAGDTPATPGTGHIGDYALYVYSGIDYEDSSDYGSSTLIPDLSDPEVRAATGVTPHADNCLADFLRASRSFLGLTMGGSWPYAVGPGMEDYAAYRGYTAISTYLRYGEDEFNLGILAREISNGRPVLVGVDSDGNGSADHAVTAIGYDFLTGRYACYTTGGGGIEWYDFTAVGSAFGVDSGVLFRLTA